jgi:hypothetical protein
VSVFFQLETSERVVLFVVETLELELVACACACALLLFLQI